MFARVVNNKHGDGELREVPTSPRFSHTVLDTILDNKGQAVGKRITLCYPDPQDDVVVELPRDGHAVFFMNDDGNTVDSVRWPPKRGS